MNPDFEKLVQKKKFKKGSHKLRKAAKKRKNSRSAAGPERFFGILRGVSRPCGFPKTAIACRGGIYVKCNSNYGTPVNNLSD